MPAISMSRLLFTALTAAFLLLGVSTQSVVNASEGAELNILNGTPEEFKAGSFTLDADVTTPEGVEVKKVVFVHNNKLVAVIPAKKGDSRYSAPIVTDKASELQVLTVTAFFSDGTQANADRTYGGEAPRPIPVSTGRRASSPHIGELKFLNGTPEEFIAGHFDAKVEVHPPGGGAEVTKVAFMLNDKPIAEVPGKKDDSAYSVAVTTDKASDHQVLTATAFFSDGTQANGFRTYGVEITQSLTVSYVELYVSSNSRPDVLSQIKDSDVKIFENGRRQDIDRLELVANLPVNVSLLIDVSGSMNEKMDGAKKAAEGFIHSVIKRNDDQVAVSAFNERLDPLVPLTTDKNRALEALRSLKAGGNTALYDAIYHSIRLMRGTESQKTPVKRALVVLTDGMEEGVSRVSQQELIEYIKENNVSIYVIDYGKTPDGTVDPDAANKREAFRQLKEFSAGSITVMQANPETLNKTYSRIERDFRSQIMLGYYSKSVSTKKAWRDVEVQIPKLRDVKYKTGYSAN